MAETEKVKQRAPTLYLIIAIKLGKGLLFVLLAFGVFKLMNQDLPAEFEKLIRWMNLDPEKEIFSKLEDKIATITPGNIRWLASGTLLYGLLSLVEGVGLIFRLRWVGWLVAGESALLIPYEIYKLMLGFSWLVFAVLVINIWIVWYLVQNRNRLFPHHHHH